MAITVHREVRSRAMIVENGVGGDRALLATHPQEWERLVADPSLRPGAVEEVIRIGSHLARLQALTTMEEMLRRLPDIRLPAGQAPTFFHSTVTRDMLTLPLEFTPDVKEGAAS